MDAGQPFVGRQAELELLLGRMAAAQAGRGGVLLVSGPPGIGKTRLIAEAATRYAEGGGTAAVGRGQCSDDRGAPPLWPWSRALRAVGGPALAAVLEPAVLEPAAGIVPDPGAVAAARFRLLTAATDAVLQAAAVRSLLLVLEDLHWADAESLELLRRVAAEAGTAPLLLLVSHRDVLPEPVAAAVADTRRCPGVATLPLPPLTRADVDRYLRAVGTAAPAAAVHARTGGLPLLLTAAVSDVDGAAEGDLQVVVSGLLARLAPGERAVVEALAVAGPAAGPAVLAEMSGVDGPVVRAGLGAGRRAGLLGPAGEDGVPFAHALLRDGVRRALDPAAAAALHRRAAEALAARLPADPALAGEIAAHWRQVVGQDAARRAADHAVLAAGHAGRALALDDAVGHLRDAVDSLRAAGADDGEHAGLLIRLATAEFLAGRLAASLARCEAAGRAAAAAGRPDLLAGAALVVRGVTNPQVADVVVRLCRSALAAGQPDGTRARLLAQLATMAAETGGHEEAVGLAAEALRLAEADGEPAVVLDAARARELTLLDADASDERLRLGRLAVTAAGDRFEAVLGAGWQLRAAYQLGRLDLVDDAYAVMERVADRTGQPLARWHLVRATAARAAMEGRFEHARECNRRAQDLAGALGDPVLHGMGYAHASHVARLRGDPGELPEGAWAELAAAPSVPLIQTTRANALLLTGRRDEAYPVWEGLRAELAAGMRTDFRLGAVLFHLADLAVAFQDEAVAEALTVHLGPYEGCAGAVGIHTAYFSGSPLRELGLVTALAGRPERGIALLRAAITADIAVRARPWVALCRLELAGLLHRHGDPAGEATGLIRQAADEMRRLDMPGPLARADRLAAAVAAARAGADPLTAREREVADLVVRALTNRDIAERLVLSERTVESHVRSILAKLGCTNRTELIGRHAAELIGRHAAER
ncbi:MAG TPA: AAA family ATPase [Mycobacteriales bacterium]